MICTATSEHRASGNGVKEVGISGQRTHIPLWQLRPVHPGAQLQRPVVGSQCPWLAHAHLIWQPVPYQPAEQAVGDKEGELSSLVVPAQGRRLRPRPDTSYTYCPGSGYQQSQGDTGRFQSQGCSWHRAHMRGRSLDSQAPNGPRDNLEPTPRVSYSFHSALAGTLSIPLKLPLATTRNRPLLPQKTAQERGRLQNPRAAGNPPIQK